MHTFARHSHGSSSVASDGQTKGLTLAGGWRYDLMEWVLDTAVFRRQLRALRRRTAALARLRPGESALDVGCGTGALALAIQRGVGAEGRIVGIDPSAQQIARARAKAARRRLPVDFQIGVVERLPFPDQMFDVALSTLMMHHLPGSLKRQGLVEVARVLKPGGRLVIADFQRKKDRHGRAARFHAGGSDLQDLADLLREAGFSRIATEQMPPAPFSTLPVVGFLTAYKG